jgi:hypothetical protein
LAHFARWTQIERAPDGPPVAPFFKGINESAENNRERFHRWLDEAPADVVAFIDIPPESTLACDGHDHYQQFRDLMRGQTVFERREARTFPDLQCEASIWRRAAGAGVDLARSGPTDSSHK